MELKDINSPNIQILFRGLIGGISTVGEALAMSIIMGMPILKEIINKAIPVSMRQPSVTSNPREQYRGSTNPIPEYAQKPQQYQAQHSAPKSRFPEQLKQQVKREPTYHPISYRKGEGND